MRLGEKFDRKTYEEQSRQMELGYIRNFQEGDTTIRFLEEIEADDGNAWTVYMEHWSEALEAAYPCLGMEHVCPGCRAVNPRERRTSRRYLVNAYSGEYVNVYKVPSSLIPSVTKLADKYGTLTDRDYTVSREGKGLNTKYTILPEDKSPIDIEMFRDQMSDHQKLLQASFRDAWKMSPEEMAEKMEETNGEYVIQATMEATKSESGTLKRAARENVEEFDSAKKQRTDAPPTEPRDPEADAEVTEEELRDMSRRELKGAFRTAGVKWPKDADDMTLSELVDYLIDNNEE